MDQTGFLHFISQTDIIGKFLFTLLMLMSVTTWSLIILKAVSLYRLHQRDMRFYRYLSDAPMFDEVHVYLLSHNKDGRLCQKYGPLARVMCKTLKAQAMYRSLDAAELGRMGGEQDFLMGVMEKNVRQEVLRAGSGLTVLATIASTAPFIGLFGTVWGVYHALLAIGASGAASLDQVATPVGEALIMTGVGLAVAVPAVIAYNWLSRQNRNLAEKLEAHTIEVLPAILTGRILNT